MALVFDVVSKTLLVESPATEVTIQELIDAIREFEASWDGMDEKSLANASGKQDLGGGVKVGITLELINNWRIQFEGTQGPDWITCYVRGGNLVAVNDYGNDPIKSSAYTNVIIAQSTAPSLISALDLADVVLKRGMSHVEDAADPTSLAALVLAAFESQIVEGLWTIRKTDGSTFTTKEVERDPNAVPIVGVT